MEEVLVEKGHSVGRSGGEKEAPLALSGGRVRKRMLDKPYLKGTGKK